MTMMVSIIVTVGPSYASTISIDHPQLPAHTLPIATMMTVSIVITVGPSYTSTISINHPQPLGHAFPTVTMMTVNIIVTMAFLCGLHGC